MTQPHDDTSAAAELWRWLLGGLIAGGVILGLLIAAYAIGYHRAHQAGRPEARVAPPSTTTTTPAASPTPGPVTATPALVAQGKTLYTRDNCAGCHSLSGTAGAGPSFKGLAGGTTTLDDGTTVAVDDAYLERAIADPDAQIVKGYTAGLMGPAIASFDLGQKPDDIRALVAFIKSQK
jgi:mono/diheme cytochrome c family protein